MIGDIRNGKDKTQGLILVIDDEEDLREMVQYQFEAKGYKVVSAVDGVDGLEKLKEMEPDLITLDINMPRMNGVEFYSEIKGDNDKPKYPVLVLTARANMEQLFRDLDVDGFISKPFEIDALVKEAEDIIKRNKRRMVAAEGAVSDVRARSICIVDDGKENLEKIALKFLDAGYIVNIARSGASAIKRISMDPPDVVLMKEGLPDLSGDVVFLKLKQNDAFQKLQCVLFDTKSASDINVSDNIGKKSGIDCYLGTNNPNELLGAIDEIFADKRTE